MLYISSLYPNLWNGNNNPCMLGVLQVWIEIIYIKCLAQCPGKHWLNGSIYYWGGNYLQLSHGNKQLICASSAKQAKGRQTWAGWEEGCSRHQSHSSLEGAVCKELRVAGSTQETVRGILPWGPKSDMYGLFPIRFFGIIGCSETVHWRL